ncbi:MAG: hypothetical protein K6E47_14575 [Lachnospiraceae bacterium]|nr:hypothetical protein [Lachnospiraceae bacterium]
MKIEDDVKYQPLDVGTKLPSELEVDIKNFLEYINGPGDHLSEDCYRTEINCSINWCLREKKLDEATCQKLKEYYVHKGIYKN